MTPHRTEFAANRGPIVFIAVKDFFVECCLSDWKISSCGGLWWVVGTQTAADILIGDKEFDRGRRYHDIDA